MGQCQLKCNQFKVFNAWLGPNQTVSAFKQELTPVSPLKTAPWYD